MSATSKTDALLDELRTLNSDPTGNIEQPQEGESLFLVKSASKWIQEATARPIPKMLFGEFWFEGELCISFADTNLGKSILAVQIGNSISRGEQIPGFTLEGGAQTVLYFDFELSDKQFEARYSNNYTQHYFFNSNFLRAEINPDSGLPNEFKTYEEFLEYSFEREIQRTGARVLIIDNLTYLKNETERAKEALPLMKSLKALKSRYKLSILALAHTPKRDMSKPITRNDLQGSKMLINFCDSSFAIGESTQDSSIRYLKQIKQRNTEEMYGSDNVCICQVCKPHNFLKFEFLDYGKEWEHLRQHSENDREKRLSEILELKEQGVSNVVIARRFGVSEGAIRKTLKKADASKPNELDHEQF